MSRFTYFQGDVDKFIVPLDGFDQTLDIKHAYYRPDYYFQNNYIDNGSIFFALESDNSYLNNVSNIQNNTELECDTNGCSAILSTDEVSPDRNTGIGISLTIPKYTGSKRLIKFSYNGIHVFSVMQVQENHFYCYFPNLNYASSGNSLSAIKNTKAYLYSLFIHAGIVTKAPTNRTGIVTLQNLFSEDLIIDDVLPTLDTSNTLSSGNNLYSLMTGAFGGSNGSSLAIPDVDISLSTKFLVIMKYYYVAETPTILNPDDPRLTPFYLYAINNNTNVCYILGTIFQNENNGLVHYSYITQGNW